MFSGDSWGTSVTQVPKSSPQTLPPIKNVCPHPENMYGFDARISKTSMHNAFYRFLMHIVFSRWFESIVDKCRQSGECNAGQSCAAARALAATAAEDERVVDCLLIIPRPPHTHQIGEQPCTVRRPRIAGDGEDARDDQKPQRRRPRRTTASGGQTAAIRQRHCHSTGLQNYIIMCI